MGTQGKAAIIYCRVSTKGQEEEGTSLESQEAACVAKAQELGFTEWRVTREAHTGTELYDRPLLTRDRKDLKEGKYQALIFYKRDRLSRKMVHRFIIIDECKRHGVQVISVTEKLGDTPEDLLFESVDAYVSEKEIETTKERTMRGKRQNALNGRIHNYAPELYGYRRDRSTAKRVTYEPEAAIVREIYSMIVSERIGGTAAATRLNRRGTPPASAGKYAYSDPERRPIWNASQIIKMVRNPAYKGETYSGMNRSEGERIRLPDDVTPCIVSPALWQQAQDILSERHGEITRNEKHPSLLRGMVFCAVCGRKMYHEADNTHRRAYIPILVCSSRRVAGRACGASRVFESDLEAWVWARVSNALRHPETIAAELERRRAQGPDETLASDLETAKREYAKCDRDQAKVMQRYTASNAEDKARDRLWQLVENEVARLEREKERYLALATEIEGRIADRQQSTFQLERLVEYCARVSQNLDSFGFEDKRMAFQALQVRVTANGGDWDVDGSIPIQVDGVDGDALDTADHYAQRSASGVSDTVCWHSVRQPRKG